MIKSLKTITVLERRVQDFIDSGDRFGENATDDLIDDLYEFSCGKKISLPVMDKKNHYISSYNPMLVKLQGIMTRVYNSYVLDKESLEKVVEALQLLRIYLVLAYTSEYNLQSVVIESNNGIDVYNSINKLLLSELASANLTLKEFLKICTSGLVQSIGFSHKDFNFTEEEILEVLDRCEDDKARFMLQTYLPSVPEEVFAEIASAPELSLSYLTKVLAGY